MQNIKSGRIERAQQLRQWGYAVTLGIIAICGAYSTLKYYQPDSSAARWLALSFSLTPAFIGIMTFIWLKRRVSAWRRVQAKRYRAALTSFVLWEVAALYFGLARALSWPRPSWPAAWVLMPVFVLGLMWFDERLRVSNIKHILHDFESPEVKSTLDDELAVHNRYKAYRTGFWAAIVSQPVLGVLLINYNGLHGTPFMGYLTILIANFVFIAALFYHERACAYVS